MASVSWPLSLPQFVLAAGYGESPPNTVIRTEMSAGPAKVRRRSTAGVRPIACQVRLSHAQRAILDAFFVDDTKSGSLAFDWLHPITRAPVEARFVEPPAYSVSGSSVHVIAALSLEILP
jgi:hypothetical protein